MRIVTIIVSILGALATSVIAWKMLGTPDPDLGGLDTQLGWSTVILCLVTSAPALFLALRSRLQKVALLLALAYPVGLGALIGYFYYTYFA